MIEYNDNQRRVFIDAAQLYEAYMDHFRKSRSYRGGMHWKKAKGREYLFRSRNRNGYGESLGPRSADTEKIYERFHLAKKDIQERKVILKERMKEQSRFCKAALIQRVPRVVTAILRILDQQKILGQNVLVVGTNILYAYEAAAGVFFNRALLATQDMDILWDVRPRLTLVMGKGLKPGGMLGLLKKADRSFEKMGRAAFQAVNREGYMVDLIKAEPRQIAQKDPFRMGDPGDLEAAEIKNLQWLVSSPKFEHIVIGEDGYPARMIGPDPRAFSLHKMWLSLQKDREPLKKDRDADQGLAVARLLLQHLPKYEFSAPDLRMFPAHVIYDARQRIASMQSNAGFDEE